MRNQRRQALRRLSLGKETVLHLSPEQLERVAGGWSAGMGENCKSDCCPKSSASTDKA
jgi:hypothetical protein